MPRSRSSKFGNDAKDNAQLATQLADLTKKTVAANTVVILGDSITNQNIINSSYSDRGYFVWGNAFLGQTFKLLKNAGVSGQRTDHVLTRLESDVFAFNPAWCVVLGGTNDLIQGIDSTTIFNNLVTIYDKLKDKGIRVIASTVPPSTSFDTTAKKQAYFELNRKLKQYAQGSTGIILVDMGSAYLSPNDSVAVSGATASDLLHPSALGAIKMGEIFANEMKKHIKIIPSTLSFSNMNTENLLLNGSMYGTSGQLAGTPVTTGVIADNWVSVPWNVTVVGSKRSRDEVLGAEWQALTCTNGSADGSFQFYTETTTGFVVGDTVEASLEMEVEPGASITQKIDVVVECKNASNANVGSPLSPLIHESSLPNLNYAPKGAFIVKSPQFVIPADTVKIRLLARVSLTSGVIKYGRAEIRKV